mgnify:CR=1 FL=1
MKFGTMDLVFLLATILIMYFLFFLPQRRKQQALNKMLLQQIQDDGTWDRFLGDLAQQLADLKLETVRQHVDVWSKIASGLEDVGK